MSKTIEQLQIERQEAENNITRILNDFIRDNDGVSVELHLHKFETLQSKVYCNVTLKVTL